MGIDAQIVYITNGCGKVQHLEEITVDTGRKKMKNRQWNKLTTERYKQFCNEWCCPCNDGSTGCFANDFYEMLCDNSTLTHLHSGEEDLFDRLQEESYKRMVESYGDPEIYERFCEKFVKELGE